MSGETPPKRGDKFAALSNTNRVKENPRRDKFAAVQQQKIIDEQQQHRQQTLDRCRQRDAAHQQIDAAEAKVTQLMDLASQTALALSQQAAGEASHVDLIATQKQYHVLLKEIHDLLAPHADLVKAYKPPERVNQMYLERVERRIAESKVSLLQEMLQQSGVDAVELSNESNDKKRKVDETYMKLQLG